MLLWGPFAAQSGVPELGRSSDAAQGTYERHIGPSTWRAGRIQSLNSVDEPPAYPTGDAGLMAALMSSCDGEFAKAVQGHADDCPLRLRFIVDERGRVTHPEIVVSEGCPATFGATRCIIDGLGTFVPAMKAGRPVRVRMEVPLHPERR